MKLYYTENEPEGILKNFFTETAKFEVKEKKKLNFQLLLDSTSSLLIFYDGKTKKYSAKIAGYRNSLTSELIKENVSLRDIFFDFGFYDQAHFNKEFKKIVGANPSLFESRQKLIKYLNLLK